MLLFSYAVEFRTQQVVNIKLTSVLARSIFFSSGSCSPWTLASLAFGSSFFPFGSSTEIFVSIAFGFPRSRKSVESLAGLRCRLL